MKNILLVLIIFLLFLVQSHAQTVHKIIVDGVINPVAAEYVKDAIERAEKAQG